MPLPIYSADAMATRGMEIYGQFNYLLTADQKPQFVNDFNKPENLQDYFDELTCKFAYAGSSLAGTRVS